ncbi:hypothetical protein [Bradyrhizobium sp. CCBAU 45384]|uniref:hypothetical protein n=1 Tax=Bradyrhizobium sp. CCBAU 45384 TaxID=858428 RepID=UPI0023069777|nr:hypothetical protein [Bradyrhizobium sp. CCBAU 45384]MDA9410479.1 hypothetical protein [Bradyrhizobium sp. CCBAU 45384]
MHRCFDEWHASVEDHFDPLIKHEAVPDCGSFEVRYGDGRPSRYFYWDELPSRRLRPEALKRDVALETARTVARTARDELEAINR